MDLRFGREVVVGTMVIVALIVFVFGTMWLSGQSFSDDDLLRIQFDDVSGLKRASPVRVSGVTVGKVEQIEFRGVGDVLVTVGVGDLITPTTEATATIVSVSLVGDYAIDIEPGNGTPLPDGAVIVGGREVGLAEKAAGMTRLFQLTVAALHPFGGQECPRSLIAEASEPRLDVLPSFPRSDASMGAGLGQVLRIHIEISFHRALTGLLKDEAEKEAADLILLAVKLLR